MLADNTVLQNRYRIIRQLGQGGMGTVYEARDLRLNNIVALKEAHFTEERMRKQFEREAQLLAGLRHQALPRVIDHFEEGDGLFLVMDYVPGEDLWEWLDRRKQPFAPAEILTWADQLLDSLDYLHNQHPPVIHRDIKPQNLKVNQAGHIILLDFGMAKGFGGSTSRSANASSIFGYTPNYAPLEQIQGEGTNARSDIYSLAATIYHLVTNTIPTDVLKRVIAVTNGDPDPMVLAYKINPEVSTEFSNILAQAMAIAPNKRFASAAEMRQRLRDIGQKIVPNVAEETGGLKPTFIDLNRSFNQMPVTESNAQTAQVIRFTGTDENINPRPTAETNKPTVIRDAISHQPFVNDREAPTGKLVFPNITPIPAKQTKKSNKKLFIIGGAGAAAIVLFFVGSILLIVIAKSFSANKNSSSPKSIKSSPTPTIPDYASLSNTTNSNSTNSNTAISTAAELNVSVKFWTEQRDKALNHPKVDEPLRTPSELSADGVAKQTGKALELKNKGYKMPLDFAELADLRSKGVLVELPIATQTYVLDVGGNATDEPFTEFDFDRGETTLSPDSEKYKILKSLADNFDGQVYDLNNPNHRKQMRIRLLRMIRSDVRKVFEDITSAYYQKYSLPLRVTSLTRSMDYQVRLNSQSNNTFKVRDSNSLPPHSTGCAFDFSRNNLGGEEQNFLMAKLAELERIGKLDALLEGGVNSAFHIFVYPDGKPPQ